MSKENIFSHQRLERLTFLSQIKRLALYFLMYFSIFGRTILILIYIINFFEKNKNILLNKPY